MIGSALVLPWSVRAADSTPANTVAPPSARMLAKAQEFRKQAQTESEAAFVRYVGNTDKAKKLFGFLGKTLCPHSDPAKGWTYFFETSIWSLSFPTNTQVVAVFYHPWSDVALVTDWTRKDTGTVLTDADLIMGDALRNLSKPPYDIEPGWLRGPVPPYLAAGISSARAVRGFEKVFSRSNKTLKDGWRAALQLGDAGLMETNHTGVGTMFERSLTGLTRYQEDAAMAPVRNQTRDTLEQIRTGRFDNKIAVETKPQVRAILKEHAAQWGAAKVITCVNKRDDQKKEHIFVLLCMPKMPELYMSFWFHEAATKSLPPVLSRIDMIDQNQSYKYLASIEKMNDAPERGDLTRATMEYADWVGRLITIGESAMQGLTPSSSAGPVGGLLGGCCDELLGRTLWDTTVTPRSNTTTPAREQPPSGKPPATSGASTGGISAPPPSTSQASPPGGPPPAGNVAASGGSAPPPSAPPVSTPGGRPPVGNLVTPTGSGPPPKVLNPALPPVIHPPHHPSGGGGTTRPPSNGGTTHPPTSGGSNPHPPSSGTKPGC